MGSANYIHNAKLTVEIVHPRLDVITTATDKFTIMNDIDVSVDSDIYHQNLFHRKRSRNEMLNNIRFIISEDAFKHCRDTNTKLIGVLQHVLKCLDPDLKFDMDLIELLSRVLYDIACNCEKMGVPSYYSSLQRKHVKTLFKSCNRSENIHLNIYYTYNQEDN